MIFPMSKKWNSVLLASGGLDSTTLAYKLTSEEILFVPLFVNYGQHCAETELQTLRAVLPESVSNHLKVLDVSDVYQGSPSRLIKEPNLWDEAVSYRDFYLPYRTLLLLSVGAAFAQSHGYSTVYSGFINSNHAQEIDCSSEFFSQLDELFSDYGGVQIEMPFRYLSKLEVAQIGIELGARIGETFSCQASADIPCGACPNCVDRLEALEILSTS